MAHDPHATAWIQNIKAARKHADDTVDPYYKRFIQGHEVPTRKDAEDLQKAMTAMHQMADKMHDDLLECQRAMSTFGGSRDTWFNGNKELLASIKKMAH